MNYSFILPNNNKLENLKIKITGKDPINIIESDKILDNMIEIENGEQMSKMIVGKALKYNEELINDEKKEIEFAKKYQILSKNTALFAEILNEKKQKSKLIKVNLNEYKNEIPRFYPKMIRPMVYGAARISSGKAARRSYFSPLASHSLLYSSNINKKIKDDITTMIMGQDIIEGFWDENEETKKLIKIISLKKFNKIKDNIKITYKGQNEIKLIYTILVIYYLRTKCSNRLEEFKLIINKANNYLENNGIKYENIISGI